MGCCFPSRRHPVRDDDDDADVVDLQELRESLARQVEQNSEEFKLLFPTHFDWTIEMGPMQWSPDSIHLNKDQPWIQLLVSEVDLNAPRMFMYVPVIQEVARVQNA